MSTGSGGFAALLGCVTLTMILVLAAVFLPLVVAQTEKSYPMSNNTTDTNYSEFADQRQATNGFIMVIEALLIIGAVLMAVLSIGIVGIMILG